MEDKEYTSLDYEEKLKEYIERKRQEFYAIIKNKALHDLIQRYELSGYKDNAILDQIALHKIGAAEIMDDVLYYLYLLDRNSRVFAKTSDDLVGSEILKKITESQLFKTNNDTLSILTLEVEQFDELFLEYKKFTDNKDFDAFMFLIEKATNFTDEERLEAYRMVAKESCSVRKKEIRVNLNKDAGQVLTKEQEQPEATEDKEMLLLKKAKDFYEKHKRFIEKDDEQTKERRISLSPLIEHLNSSGCDAYDLNEKIGIVLYDLIQTINLYESALLDNDAYSLKVYGQDLLEKLEIGGVIGSQIEKKESEENLLPNVIFLKDNRDDILVYYDVEDYTVSDKIRLFQKIKELKDPGIDKSSGQVKMNNRDSHIIHYKESGGVRILYIRLPNNVVLIVGTSKDASGIYKMGQSRDESYYSKIEELISRASTNRGALLESEMETTDTIAKELIKSEKERGAR